MNKIKKIIVALSAIIFFSTIALASELDFGVNYQDWYANSSLDNGGWELWTPLSLSLDLDKSFKLYGWSEFGSASYQYTPASTEGTETTNLTNISDTVVGGEYHFKTFTLPSMVNIGFNLPTGDPTWENQQQLGNIPTDFVDSRYYSHGFGVNVLYGLAIPAGQGQVGAAVGYMHYAPFDQDYGSIAAANPTNELELGDYIFVGFDHVMGFSDNQTQIIRLNMFQALPTSLDGQNIFELGTNFNASYSWKNPKGFSFEGGAQVWLPSSVALVTGTLTGEPNNSYGPRLYAIPSYAFGDFAVEAHLKYVLPNNYPVSSPDYFAAPGGYLLGIQPSYRLKMGDSSAFKFFASFDYILAQNGGQDANGNPVDLAYYRWVFGTNYELKL